MGEEHFRLLAGFARKMVLAYDADSAGQAGAGRVYEWERHHEVDVVVASLPPGADPADVVRDDPEALRQAVANAKPFLLFRLERVLDAADLRTLEGRAKAAQAAMAVVAEHPNDLVRDQYVMVVADRCRLDPATLRPLADAGALRQFGGRLGQRTSPPGRRVGAPARAEARPRCAPASRPFDWRCITVNCSTAVSTPCCSPIPCSAPPLMPWWRPRACMTPSRRPSLSGRDTRSRSAARGSRAAQAADVAGDTLVETPVAQLLRRLAVEEPAADADAVVVQLVRNASRRALAEVDAQARISPETYAEVAVGDRDGACATSMTWRCPIEASRQRVDC